MADTEFVKIIRSDDTPLKGEIINQLRRMLAAPRFRNSANQADFLKLVVERALHGQKTPGHVIAKELFPDKVGTDVRVAAGNLRKTLKKYQAGEGYEDRVIIALPDPPEDKSIKLPEGDAYTPKFSYNPNHAVSNAVRLGQYHLIRATHEDLNNAIEYFSKALEISPGHLRASIGIAEALCTSLGWTFNEISDSEWDEILGRAAEILDGLGEEAYGYWRFHAAAGMFFVVVNNLAEAGERFKAALALNRAMTEAYPFYLGYLIGSGRPTEAVELARRYLDLNIDNAGAYVTCAMTMGLVGKIPEAKEVTKRALKLDKGHPGIRMLATAFKLVDAPAPESQEFSQLATILDDVSYRLLKREMLEQGALIPDSES